MDYKEKYNKLVEAVKVLQETNPSDEGIQNWVNDNVPELSKSEDEKVREDIIHLVNAHGQGRFRESMLAWLENIPYTIDRKKREGFHLGYKAELEKQGEQKPFNYECANIPQKDFSPAIGIEIPFGAKDSELQEATYLIPEGFHAEIESDKVVIKKGKQKPAWSEEDEKNLQMALYYANYSKTHVADTIEVKECINWLKSIKQRIGG